MVAATFINSYIYRSFAKKWRAKKIDLISLLLNKLS